MLFFTISCEIAEFLWNFLANVLASWLRRLHASQLTELDICESLRALARVDRGLRAFEAAESMEVRLIGDGNSYRKRIRKESFWKGYEKNDTGILGHSKSNNHTNIISSDIKPLIFHFFQDLDDEMFNQGFLKHFLLVSGGYLDEFPWNRDCCLATLGHWNQDAKNSSIIFATVDACWEHGWSKV